MTRFDLRQTIVNGKATLIVAALLYVVAFFLLRSDTVGIVNGGVMWNLLAGSFPAIAMSRWVTLLLHAVIVYMILELDTVFALNRIRSTLNISVFLWLLVVFPFLLNAGPSLFAVVFLVSSLFPLFFSYQNRDSSPKMFYTGLMFALATMFVPVLDGLVVVYLFAIAYIGVFTLRNVVGFLWGILLPYFLLWAVAYITGNSDIIDYPFKWILTVASDFNSVTLRSVLNSGTIILLVFASLGHLFYTSYLDRIKTRIMLYIISWFPLYFVLLMVLCPKWCNGLMSITLPFLSFMAGHLFLYSDSRGGRSFFYIMQVILLLLLGYNVSFIYG